MQIINRLTRWALVCVCSGLIVSAFTLCATPGRSAAAKDSPSFDFLTTDLNSGESESAAKYQWNIREKDAPLLGLDHEHLTFYHNGSQRRLTDVHGHVIKELLT